jgi:hypothetical protein
VFAVKRWLAVLALMVLAIGLPSAAWAQVVDPGEVRIQPVALGIGDRPRPGEWVGLQLQLTETAAMPREVIVQWSVKDSDGDTAQYRRAVTTNPGVKQNLWLYGRLPFRAGAGSELLLEAYLAGDGAAREAPVTSQGALGRLVGRVQVALRADQLTPVHSGQIAVVGRQVAGLDLYGVTTQVARALPKGHESSVLLDGLRVVDLPDRWMGLASTGVLVWTLNTGDADPATLTDPQVQAIREWVQRGGHLVIVMPSVGQNWTTPGSKLLDLMPRVSVERREQVNLNAYQAIFRDGEQAKVRAPLPSSASIHVFTPEPGAKPGEGVIVLAGPNGEGLVARRSLGAGAVTLIGVNIASTAMLGANATQTDVFWHRVLGRRGELLTITKMNELVGANKLREVREAIDLDDGLGASIAKTGAAARGLLLAFVVFAAYWALAGPIAFRVLKSKGKQQHSWVVFVLFAVLFTGVAWGGALMLRPTRTEATHLTFIDEVYGQPTQRARAFASVLLPRFGRMTVGVGPADEGSTDTIAGWEPSDPGAGSETFPDAAPYAIESRSPSEARVPSRSTIKSVQIDWMGLARLRMPMPAVDSPVRLGPPTEGSSKPTISGKLVHELPGPLTNARVIVVYSQMNLPFGLKDAVQASADAQVIPGEWKPGETLDLATLFDRGRTGADDRATSLSSMLDNLSPRSTGIANVGQTARALTADRLTAISLFSLLKTPDVDAMAADSVLFRRASTHNLDLSRWVTQPCVIVIGQLVGTAEKPNASPVPIVVDGQPIPSDGRTVVRWVYPLGSRPPTVGSFETKGKP